MKISYISVKGSKMRTLRIKQGYTIRDLAKLAGVHYSTIALIEKGVQNPSPKTAKAIAEALKVDFEEIFSIKLEDKRGNFDGNL